VNSQFMLRDLVSTSRSRVLFRSDQSRAKRLGRQSDIIFRRLFDRSGGLLYESKSFVPEADSGRKRTTTGWPELGLGIHQTSSGGFLTPGINTLRPEGYVAGGRLFAWRRKASRRFKAPITWRSIGVVDS